MQTPSQDTAAAPVATITRAEMARLAGVSKAAISKACRRGLERACVGARVDIEHDAAVAYLEQRGIRAETRAAAAAKAAEQAAVVRADQDPRELLAKLQREYVAVGARLARLQRAVARLELALGAENGRRSCMTKTSGARAFVST